MKMLVYNFREFDEGKYFNDIVKRYGIDTEYTEQTPTVETAVLAKGFECVNVITTKIDRPILEKLKEYGVKYVTTRTIGYDHIDVKAAKELGIRVSNITYSPDTVAEYTVMLMLMAKRKMKRIMERAVIQDYTLKGIIGSEINKSVVGVIGTGRIGETVIRDLSGFGCKILAYDLYEKESVKKYAIYTELDKLLQESDIITLHMPANESNYHMIDKKAIEKMKQGVLIVNTARGALIDSNDLIEGIETGKIGGAALDVVEKELGLYYNDLRSEVLSNRELAILKSFPNVIVTPHMAFYTEEAIHDMVANSIESYRRFAQGEEKISELYWNNIHIKYDRNNIKVDDWLERFDSIVASCNGLVLDLGCGGGNDTLYFIEKGKKVIACDQSINAINNIQKNFPEVLEARCFNMLDGFEFEDDSFEIVCADLCLHYFKETDTSMILNEIRRILIPGGHLFVRVNSLKDVNYGAGQGIEIEPHLYKTEDGMLKRFFDEEDVRRLFSDFDILFCEEQKMLRYSSEKIVFCVCLRANDESTRRLEFYAGLEL